MPDPVVPPATPPVTPPATPPVVPPVTPPAPAAAWHTGLDADLLGHVQTKGWQDLDPAAAAQAIAKAHRSAEQMIGVPADRALKLPGPQDPPEAWNDVWTKLGKPADGKYDLTSVKVGDQPLPQATADFLSAQANALNLSQDGAVRLAQAFVKRDGDAAAAAAAETAAKQAEEATKLAESWGANANANLVIAKATAQKFLAKAGLTAEAAVEAVSTLEGKIGYAATMQMFLALGQATGEHSFIQNDNNFNGGVLTREQAVSQKTDLMRDEAWVKRYSEGGVAEGRQMLALNRIITGVTDAFV